jgi:hypothetical protein
MIAFLKVGIEPCFLKKSACVQSIASIQLMLQSQSLSGNEQFVGTVTPETVSYVCKIGTVQQVLSISVTCLNVQVLNLAYHQYVRLHVTICICEQAISTSGMYNHKPPFSYCNTLTYAKFELAQF